MRSFPRGVTLLETVLYIGILAVILPACALFLMNIWQRQISFDARLRLQETTSIVFLELAHAITESDSILVQASTLSSDASVLKFKDATGDVVTIDSVASEESFTHTTAIVYRLRMQHGSDAPVWLTEPEHTVIRWRVDPARNSTGTLTGLNVELDLELVHASQNTYRDIKTSHSTVFAISPSTLEN